MRKNPLPLWLPLAFLFALGICAFVLPAWTDAIVALGKRSGISESWAGFAGGIIGSVLGSALTSIVAVIAIYYAYVGIRQQIRAGVLAREEDRLLRELPGLRDALELLDDIAATFGETDGPYHITDQFRGLELGIPESTLSKDLKARLPDTDDATMIQTKHSIAKALELGDSAESNHWLANRTEHARGLIRPDDKATLQRHEAEVQSYRDQAAEDMQGFKEAINDIADLADDIRRTIAVYEARLPRLRREASEYFDS
ncbi:hypothetical protein [Bradyrhizobium liaoningense]|uniref:hypothetical protein n=1 Tax=Bradyrhizobium liaoningense TaxID=43992 RepID=UPI001BA8680B|nr:hypothetical protein [Bradyrhizobium liaoningense]MBR0855644.1 hypothetical protein [Bradyrhizobium liaoningense]